MATIPAVNILSIKDKFANKSKLSINTLRAVSTKIISKGVCKMFIVKRPISLLERRKKDFRAEKSITYKNNPKHIPITNNPNPCLSQDNKSIFEELDVCKNVNIF